MNHPGVQAAGRSESPRGGIGRPAAALTGREPLDPLRPPGIDADRRFWWYDGARRIFVLGVWPIVEDQWSEEMVRQVADEESDPFRRWFASQMLDLIPGYSD